MRVLQSKSYWWCSSCSDSLQRCEVCNHTFLSTAEYVPLLLEQKKERLKLVGESLLLQQSVRELHITALTELVRQDYDRKVDWFSYLKCEARFLLMAAAYFPFIQ